MGAGPMGAGSLEAAAWGVLSSPAPFEGGEELKLTLPCALQNKEL